MVVVFKAFHEDVDSFGALPYWDGRELGFVLTHMVYTTSNRQANPTLLI